MSRDGEYTGGRPVNTTNHALAHQRRLCDMLRSQRKSEGGQGVLVRKSGGFVAIQDKSSDYTTDCITDYIDFSFDDFLGTANPIPYCAFGAHGHLPYSFPPLPSLPPTDKFCSPPSSMVFTL